MTSPGPRWQQVGAVLLLVRPLYFLSEVVAGAAFAGPYSFVDDTVSALGVVGCPVDPGTAPGCSPRHALVNGSFVLYGVLLALGALLLAGRLTTSRSGRVALVLLVVTGLGSVATGLAPLDRGGSVHLLAALPVFVAQPVALLLLAAHTRGAQPRVAAYLLLSGVVSVVGAVGFGLLIDAERAGGLVERVGLWPAFVALAVLGASWLRSPAAPAPRPA